MATHLDSKLHQLSEEALPVFNTIVRALRESSDGNPSLQRQADLAVLFAADALQDNPDPVREAMWRRMLRAVEPLARTSQSCELRSLVYENRDLL